LAEGREESGRGEQAHQSDETWQKGFQLERRRGAALEAPTAVPCGFTDENRGEMGRGRRRAALPTNYPSARGERRLWARGGRLGGMNRGRGGTRGGRLEEGEGPDGWAPPSASREREREGGAGQLGCGPGRGEGCGGFGPKWPKRSKRGEIPFPFIFFYTKFPIEFLSRKKKINKIFCFPTNDHKRNAPA